METRGTPDHAYQWPLHTDLILTLQNYLTGAEQPGARYLSPRQVATRSVRMVTGCGAAAVESLDWLAEIAGIIAPRRDRHTRSHSI